VQITAADGVVHCLVQLEQLRARSWSPHGLCHAINLIMCARSSGKLRARQLLFDTGDGSFDGTPPKLSFCSANASDALVMDPDFALTEGYRSFRGAKVRQKNWRDRVDKIIWRGSTTGQLLHPTGKDRVQGRWDWLQRLRLCHAAANSCHDDFMDIGISAVVQLDQERAQAVRESGFMRAPINTAEFGNFRYAIDVDGNTNAWSGLFTKLLMGCCVLKVESPFGFRQWYYGKMRPWEHYVPVRADLSDLDAVIEQLRRDPDTCEMIAERGQALAEDITLEKSLNEAMDAIAAFSADVHHVTAYGASTTKETTLTVTEDEVTEDDVIWCYRSLLQRAPESQEVVRGLVGAADDFRSLVMLFLNSAEYQAKHAPYALVPLSEGHMDLEVTASEQDLLRLQERIHAAWTHLGEVRPHHSVLTAREYLPESLNEESLERFFHSGEIEAATIDAMLKRHGFAAMKTGICVEFGCGLGRITYALARRFEMVHAYDVSSNHIALAKLRARDLQVRNVQFHVCEAGVQELEPCDFLFSCLVFQHNPPPIICSMISSSLRSLREGGMAIFQVPTFGARYTFSLQNYLATPPQLDIEMHCVPQHTVFEIIAEHGCSVREVREDDRVGNHEWISNTFVVRRH